VSKKALYESARERGRDRDRVPAIRAHDDAVSVATPDGERTRVTSTRATGGPKLDAQVVDREPVFTSALQPVRARCGLEAGEQRVMTPCEVVPT